MSKKNKDNYFKSEYWESEMNKLLYTEKDQADIDQKVFEQEYLGMPVNDHPINNNDISILNEIQRLKHQIHHLSVERKQILAEYTESKNDNKKMWEDCMMLWKKNNELREEIREKIYSRFEILDL